MAENLYLEPGLQHSEVAGVAVPKTQGEQRESERALLYWRQKVAQFGDPPPLMSLELTRMLNRDWNHRFLISTDPSVENYIFLIYGRQVARLLDLPDEPVQRVPMIRQLPQRYLPVFVDGCSEAASRSGPVRKSGRFERWDSQVELFRVVFVPVTVRPNSAASLVYGAINYRILSKPPGADGSR